MNLYLISYAVIWKHQIKKGNCNGAELISHYAAYFRNM